MRIRKYDFDYSRRFFLDKTARGLGGAGVLKSLWPTLCHAGDAQAAYPDELLSIEAFTKGEIKVGDVIDADNAPLIQDLLDPISYQAIIQNKRKIFILPERNDLESLFPPYFLDATMRNQGQAVFDAEGNVRTKDGDRWVGGIPFPNVQTGEEAIANITLSWGRHDSALYATPAVTVDNDGNERYEYDWIWGEQQLAGLVNPDADSVHHPNYNDLLRMQVIWFTHTQDVRGSAFLSHWKYDQHEIPKLWGYLKNFKRVRRFPANQRFEPYMPGMNLFLSDAWASGDPMLTWGNWKVIHRGPFLGSSHSQWMPENENWRPPLGGGEQDKTYFYVGKCLIPEVIVFEGEPVGYPNAPVGKRRIYMDARNMGPGVATSFDRAGNIWKSLEGGGGLAQAGDERRTTKDGRTEWTWAWAMSTDLKTHSVSRFHHAETCRGNGRSVLDPNEDLINAYMTKTALMRLGV